MDRLKIQTEILFVIKKLRLEYLGHLMRGEKYKVLQVMLQRKIEVKKSPGPRKQTWLNNLMKWFNTNKESSLFHKVKSKEKIAQMIANLQQEMTAEEDYT